MNPVFFFDTIIILGTFFSFASAAFFFYRHRLKTKHRYRGALTSVLCAIPGLVLVYGSFIEPQIIIERSFAYTFPQEKKLAPEKRIVLISDIHVGPYKQYDFSRRVVERIKKINPDAVLIAGDFFFHHTAQQASEHLQPYAELAAMYPTIAVLGNHEFLMGWDDARPDYEEAQAVRDVLNSLGILELEDAVTTLFPDEPIELIGAQDIWSGVDDFSSIELPDRSRRSITLVHNPDLIVDTQNKVDLVLAGHTHGGQIRLPFIGPLASPGLTMLPRSAFKGPSQWGATTLYVTAGIGESGPRARLFNPPEIVVITLR